MNTLEVYADLWCPFAYVGLLRAVTQRNKSGSQSSIVIRSWPLELINGEPMSADKAQTNIDALREQINPDLFGGFRAENFPTSTLSGLSLVAAVGAKDPQQGEVLSMELRNLLFERGVDINDHEVLVELAERYFVDPAVMESHDAVIQDWHEGQARGVKGSPHFFCGDSEIFCPGLNIEKDAEGKLCIQETYDCVEDFLNRCLT